MGKAPARGLSPEVRENDTPEPPIPVEQVQINANLLPYLRLLWENRRLMLRAGVYSFLASMLIAFLIPTRYESSARLMPPDSSQSGGLAMAAATLSGGAGGLGGIASEMLGLKSTKCGFRLRWSNSRQPPRAQTCMAEVS
jgi:hypothetical protein